MQQYYDEKQLVDSFTFRKKFGDDAFDLFKLFYPNRYEVRASDGYRTIYTKDDKTTVSYFGKLGANYKAFTFLMNTVIDKFIQDGILSKPGECDPRYLPGYEKIMDYLRNNQVYFVSLLPELGQIIKKTSDLGDKAEMESEEALRRIFGENIEIRNSSGLGKKEDTHGGKDRVMVKDGKSYNVQVKVCKNIQLENGLYYVERLGAKQYYNIDIIVFKRGYLFYAFWAKGASGKSVLQIWGNREGYMIPQQYLIKITRLEARKDIQNNTQPLSN
jgi:hypothetical protein